jgi:hypothetical protein
MHVNISFWAASRYLVEKLINVACKYERTMMIKYASGAQCVHSKT